jgi:coenzyme F420-reducing hydrogenase gamma subunit
MNNLDEQELLEVLNDEDPYEFVFTESGIQWKDEEVSNAQIKEAREKFMISYGSCSFDEPIDDLKTMELL